MQHGRLHCHSGCCSLYVVQLHFVQRSDLTYPSEHSHTLCNDQTQHVLLNTATVSVHSCWHAEGMSGSTQGLTQTFKAGAAVSQPTAQPAAEDPAVSKQELR